MMREEIKEYPYIGTIIRVVEGQGDEDDTTSQIYSGEMDEYMATDDEYSERQTASYIVSIPMPKYGTFIMPQKGDEIHLERYGETLDFVVDNAEPSQLGGVSIYATRKTW